MKVNVFKYLFFTVVVFFFIHSFAWGSNLEVHIIDVGQGDCQLIISPSGKTVLIDTGTGTKATGVVLPYLDNLGISSIDYLVATHYDRDHIAGVDEVIDGLGGISKINYAVYDRGGSKDSSIFDTYLNSVQQKRETIEPEDVIDLGGSATLTCIASGGKTKNGTVYDKDDENELSVVLILNYFDFQVYFGGDLGENMEPYIGPLAGDMDVYKVSHHGSKYSSTRTFLEEIIPEVSTISVGNNSYDHPTLDVFNRLANVTSYIYQTEKGNRAPSPDNGEVANGSFKIESDGCSYTVSGSDLHTATYYTDASHGCPHVVFSEVLYDSEVYGDTAGEWLRLYNQKTTAVDIGGCTIEDNYKSYTIPPGTTIGARSYLIIANDQASFYQVYGFNPDIPGLALELNNDGDYLTLKNSSGTVIDQVAWESGGSNISGWGSSSEPYANEGKSIARADVGQDTDRYTDWLNNQNPNPGNAPKIALNRTRLNFGASNGVETNAQTFSISNPGCGTLEWTVTDNAGWFSCTPTTGTNSGLVTVSVNSMGLAADTYTGTVTVSAPGAANSPRTLTVTLEVYHSNTTSVPFGEFASPLHGAAVSSSIPVTGWVLDDIEVVSVKIYNGPDYIGDAIFVEGARPDVEQAYFDFPKSFRAGWGYMMLTNFLPNGGNGTYTIYAKATDAEGNQVTLGAKTIHVDNANAVKPFGALDTPTQGGTASGSSFINWGWVLTPQPKNIPVDGSTINVYVDGVNIGHPVYNIYRADIASLFPGYANSNGSAGYFPLDTTAYANGVHTIQWTATDNQGVTDGIGSRYFSVENMSGRSVQEAMSRVYAQKQIEYNTSPFSKIIIDSFEPIRIKMGYNENLNLHTRYPDNKGTVSIQIKELERIEIHLGQPNGFYNGYLKVGNQLRKLPIGSSLDSKRGVFYWTPGPGFIGSFEFIFIQKQFLQLIKKSITINIVPRSNRSKE
jgi:beta-lactamase superfamily II metal-dependent hydrolase